MQIEHFVKVRIWDFILTVLCQIGLVFNVFPGFILTDKLNTNYVLVILMFIVLDVIFFGFSYNRTTTMAGIITGAVFLAIVIFWAASTKAFSDESAHSLGITVFLIVFTGLIVFLLGRRRGLIIVLFVLGTIINAGSHFLLYEVHVWTFLVFEVAVFLLFLYRSYVNTVTNVQTGRVRIRVFASQSAMICLMAFALGCAAFFGIVRPLDPPTRELKLITVLEDMDILKVFGVSSMREMLDPDKLTEDELKKLINANDLTEEEKKEFEEQKKEEKTDESKGENKSGLRTAGKALSQFVFNIFRKLGFIWIMVIIAAIIGALFALKYYLRKKWLEDVGKLSPENQVVNYYRYFLSRLSKFGYRKPIQHTLKEYAGNISHETEAFQSGDVTFEKLTDVYMETYYGGHSVSEEKLGWFRSFYDDFRKNAKEELGLFKYCLKYFAI